MTAQLLVVDDETSLLEVLRLMLQEESYRVTTAGSYREAIDALQRGSFELVICDIMMPDGNGLDLLREIKQKSERTSVIMMTAYDSTRSAIEAMRLGAYDYVSKPFDIEEMRVLVAKALERSELLAENVYLKRELRQRYTFSNIIGRSRRMQEVFSLIERVARTNSTVLIHGESGTGKELIARAIHFNSPRSNSRFLSLNCGALPENLLESELFGHEKGSFTGAVKEKKGLFQEAEKGTLFLDEISETTPTMQVKLLRALQERVVRKVGGTREEPIDVRIIAATNRDLQEQIQKGAFREDLYYRINVIPIQLPPLRIRREDIPLLIEHFATKFNHQLGASQPVRFSVEALRLFEEYDWPGNVRELENMVERVLALRTSDLVTVEDLPQQLRHVGTPPNNAITLPADGLNLEQHLESIRARLMEEALERTDWVQTQAAELLRMSFRSFRYYAKKAGLTGRRGLDDAEADEAPTDEAAVEVESKVD